MASRPNICASLLAAALLPLAAQPAPKSIVAITASAGDYIKGAGGTLARFIDEGFAVYVIQTGNDEKISTNGNPAETRLANNADALRAAKALGVTEVFNLNNKSGELSQLSSNELRNQISTLIRLFQPQKLFLPDPFIHYDPDWDRFFTARAAEETNYSNAGMFLPELTRAGLKGFSVPETYYYSANRPYRPGEGGHNGARLEAIDITKTFPKKAAAIRELRTANQAFAAHTRLRLEAANRPSPLLQNLDPNTIAAVAQAWIEELATTIGAKHGLPLAEEFNYHGAPPGEKRPPPPWILEHATPNPKITIAQ